MSEETTKKTQIDLKGVLYGESVVLRAVLTDEDGNPIPGRPVDFYYAPYSGTATDVIAFGLTNKKGADVIGVRFGATFMGDREYGDAWAGAPIPRWLVLGEYKGTILTLDAVYFDDSARLTARLTDEDGNPVPDEEIDFNGSSQPSYFEWGAGAITDDQGIATVTAPKYNWYFATFWGDKYRKYSPSRTYFTALPNPVLEFEITFYSDTVRLGVRLTDKDGKPLLNRPIDFYVVVDDTDVYPIGTVNTGRGGVAIKDVQLRAKFPGDSRYEISRAVAQFVTREPLPSPEPSPSPSQTQSVCCSFWDIGCWFFRPDRAVCLFGKEANGLLLTAALMSSLSAVGKKYVRARV